MAKRIGFILAGAALIFASDARAFSSLTCRDSGKKVIFDGLVAEAQADQPGKFKHERTVSYSLSISSQPTQVIDRKSLARLNGVELPNCKGPYVYIYERHKAGNLRCAAGEITPLENFQLADAAVLESFGRTKQETDCSLIVDGK